MQINTQGIVIYFRSTFYIPQDTPETIFASNIVFFSTKILLLCCVYIKLSWDSFFLKNIKSVHLSFSSKNFLHQSKKSINFNLSTRKSADTKLLLPKPRKYWEMEHYWGSAIHVEVDLDSDVNLMSSGNLRQSTNVPSQCEKFPFTWMLCLLYFYHWYHFRKRPSIV